MKQYQKQSPETVKIIPLGGLEEIGRNMTVVEYGDDILIIDMGLQFPEEDTPGIDYIIPNIAYLEPKKKKIKGVIITHAHLDHIGGVPHLMEKLGNPTIYAAPLTRAILLKRQTDFPSSPRLDIEAVQENKIYKTGVFQMEFFRVNHNIPDAIGVVIHTPLGKIVSPAEFKFDYDRAGRPKNNIQKLTQIGNSGVLALLLDSTRAEEPGRSMPESQVERTIEEIIRKSKGRIIFATFASHLDRLKQVILIAERYHRKVAISGYSMKSNIEIAKNLGYLKTQKGTIIPIEESHRFPDRNLVYLCTGAQGEDKAVLMRIANQEHRFIKIKKGDTVILSSSVIPGNERAVQNLRDNLSRQGALVLHYRIMDIHSSGHAPQEDLKAMVKIMKPKFLMPIHGYYYMRKTLAELAKDWGIKPQASIVVDNGNIVEINRNGFTIQEEKVPTYYIMVDGLGVGDVGDIVVRDRKMLASDGMLVIIVSVDKQTGNLLREPDIISRGFIYLKESKELIDEIKSKVKKIIDKIPGDKPVDSEYIKEGLRDKIGQFIFSRTQRRPMVLPVVIEI